MNAATTTFYVTGGTLRYDAPSYVERQADRDLLDGLLQGEFCYVLTSRQMGKSSLMVRTAGKLRERGTHVVVLDLTAIGQNLTPEQWYDGLIVQMGRQLRLEDELDRYWASHAQLGPCQRFFAAVRDAILPALQNRADATTPAIDPEENRSCAAAQVSAAPSLIVFVDEIDVVRNLPFSTDEFFAATRECYNRRAEDPELNRVTFCLLGVATPSDLIRDTRLTPFNIGQRIELNDFTAEEAAPLAEGLKSPRFAIKNPRRLLQRILHWTGGHPYLTQRLCRAVAEVDGHRGPYPASVASGHFIDSLCEGLFFSNQARERDDNLVFVRERLLRAETDLVSLLEHYLKVRHGKKVIDDETSLLVSVLKLSGVVKAEGGYLRERNRIYSSVFDREWVRTHMPDADLRRQRMAFYRGVFRTTAIAAVVVAAMTIMVVIAVNQARRARAALAQAYFSHARARRVSAVAGQRYESLQALRGARPYYTNPVALRDEVIACLALVDLKERTNGASSFKQPKVFELNLDLEVSAAAETGGAISLHKLKDAELLTTLPGFGWPVNRLHFCPKGTALVAGYHTDSQNQLLVWDWRNQKRLFAVTNILCGAALDFSADGRKLAVSQSDGHIIVCSVPDGRILHELKVPTLATGFPRLPRVVRFNPSGNLLAESCLDDAYVQIWDLLSPEQEPIRLYHSAIVHDVSWHPQGRLLATACRDSCVYLWDTHRTEKPVKKFIGHENDVVAVTFNNHGNLIASLGLDETVRLWIPPTDRQMTRRLEGEIFDRLRFSADDRLLSAIDNPQTNARVWEVSGEEYRVLQVLTGPLEKLRNIDFSPDSRLLAAISDERATIWDANSGCELGPLNLTHAQAAWFSADSQHLVASTDGGLVKCSLGRPGDRNQPRFLPGSFERLTEASNELGAMVLTLDRSKAAIVRQDEVHLVSLEPSHKSGLRTIPVGVHYHRLALHPQGVWMAAMIGETNSIDLWNLSQVTDVHHSQAAILSSQYFVFSPEGKWLVTCWAGKFQFYQVGDWQKPVFSVPRKPASDQQAPIAFTEDGSIVALATSRYTIQLLRLPDGNLIATLESPDHSPLEMLAFSPDGRHLAAATIDQTIQLWNVALLRESLAELKLDIDWPDYP